MRRDDRKGGMMGQRLKTKGKSKKGETKRRLN